MSDDNISTDVELVPVTSELERSISGLNQPLSNFLRDIGLPTENVLYPISERRNVIHALKEALSILPIEERQKAFYLTKFTVAITLGLFDGALNYLWDETISAIRKLILKFDLEYFFSILQKFSSRYKNFSTVEDLEQVSDHDLLEASRRIGLLSDVNYSRLEHVNYMRNHASAAHPNDQELDGFEILAWLRTCLRYAITAEPDHSAISIKRLLNNLRSQEIPSADFITIGADIVRQPQERLDDLLWTLFGMYTEPVQASHTKTNIRNLAKYVWDASSENRKYEIGAKYGVFRKNAEVDRKDAAQDFLQIVGGQHYKDEDSLAGELIEKLEILKSVHFVWYNFYNEYPHAKSLSLSIPPSGKIPRAARHSWVKVTCLCYIGNGKGYREGVDESAIIYYNQFIENFSEPEIVEFLHLMGDAEFTTDICRDKADERTRKLCRLLQTKSSDVHIQRALNLIIEGPKNKLDRVHLTTEFKEALRFIPKK